MPVNIYKPPGLDSNQDLIELNVENSTASGAANAKPLNARMIVIPNDSNKIYHSYYYLGDLLNWRRKKIAGGPRLVNNDLIILEKIPAKSYIAHMKFLLYREKIDNYNPTDANQVFEVQPGFCVPGSNTAAVWLADLPISSSINMLSHITNCRTPMLYWEQQYNQRYVHNFPVCNWFITGYSADEIMNNEVEFCLRVRNINANISSAWQMHIWFSYIVL